MKKRISILSIAVTGLILTGCGADPYSEKEEITIKEAPRAQQAAENTQEVGLDAIVNTPAFEIPAPERDEVRVESVTTLQISNPELFE